MNTNQQIKMKLLWNWSCTESSRKTEEKKGENMILLMFGILKGGGGSTK